MSGERLLPEAGPDLQLILAKAAFLPQRGELSPKSQHEGCRDTLPLARTAKKHHCRQLLSVQPAHTYPLTSEGWRSLSWDPETSPPLGNAWP